MLAQLAQRIHDRVGEEDGDGEGTGPILISDDCTVHRSFSSLISPYYRTDRDDRSCDEILRFWSSKFS